MAFFVDPPSLRAAFDTVDRKILIETMRKRGIRERIVNRYEDLLGETKNKVRAGEAIEKEF